MIDLINKRKPGVDLDLSGIEFGDGFKVLRKKPSTGYGATFDVTHLACGGMRVLSASKINQARKKPDARGYRAQVCVPCKKARAAQCAAAS